MPNIVFSRVCCAHCRKKTWVRGTKVRKDKAVIRRKCPACNKMGVYRVEVEHQFKV
jgi:hypothetical protein